MNTTTTRYAAPARFGAMVRINSRAQASADDRLLDLSPLAAALGLRLPVYITREVWRECCAWTDADSARQKPQNLAVRVRNLLESLIDAARGSRGSIIEFRHERLRRGGRSRRPCGITLQAECAGADPRITVRAIYER